MWLVQHSQTVPTLHNRDKIAQLVDQSLLGDCAIRIEHSGVEQNGAWVQWGQTLFAIKSAEQVMAVIDACHTSCPSHDIRISAEKFRPQMRMVYNVCRAADAVSSDDVSITNTSPSEAANQMWTHMVAASRK